MSEKTDQKRQLILNSAAKVFADKGYRAVTMKDIVEASGISRGGLYLYFPSVEDVFLAVLEMKEKTADNEISGEALANATGGEILLWFLKSQKKEILKRKDSLLMAKYEYAFSCSEKKQTAFLKKEMDKAVLVLQNILERGTEGGEFACFDPKNEAKDMMYAIEGMKLLSLTTGISEKKVDSEFLHMMERIVIEEEE